jgi:hypothetical protein
MTYLMRPYFLAGFLIAATAFYVSTAAGQNGTLDQQQAVINTQAGVVLAIGAQGQQRLAQVVTAGRSGTLNQIALVVACASQIQLVVQIQGVSSDKPNGTVLASYVFNNVGGYADPPAFKTFTLDNPLHFNAGDQFAIVLSSTPPNTTFICSTYPGPAGNPYLGGDAFGNSISDPPGQWTLIGLGISPTYGADLPFQTFVASLLNAAVLPSSRSVQVGATATAFATLLTSGTTAATGCLISMPAGVPTNFSFQRTDANNAPVGLPNTPVDIPANSGQTFVLAFTPSAPFSPANIELVFACENTSPAPVVSGVNTLLLSASNTPVPDIVMLSATITHDGIVNMSGANESGAFAVATVNVGATGNVTVSADTGGVSLPLSVALCQTNPNTGSCLSTPQASVPVLINAGDTPTFAIFVNGFGSVPLDPARNRVFVWAKDTVGGTTRGSTSVAVTAKPPPAPPSNLTATAVCSGGPRHVDLQWRDNSDNESGFTIERAAGGDPYTTLVTLGAGRTSYSDAVLEDGVTYRYRVFAFNADGNSEYTNEASVTAPPETPNVPSNLTASVTGSGIHLAWQDNSNNESGFAIERRVSAWFLYSSNWVEIATVRPNVTTYDDRVQPGLFQLTYAYTVRAFVGTCSSGYSNVSVVER